MTEVRPLYLHNGEKPGTMVPRFFVESLKAAKSKLDVPFLVKPVIAQSGQPGRVLAYLEPPNFKCDFRVLTGPEDVAESLLWALEGVSAQFRQNPLDGDGVLYFDIESHDSDLIWDMPTEEFFRLGQYAWGDSQVTLTSDLNEMRSVLREAKLIVGHNIHQFDLTAIFGKDSTEPLEMALDGKVLDTMVHASLVMPAPYKFTNRNGHTYYDAAKPEKALKWFALDNLTFQLDLPGKIGDLKALAKKYGGFGEIPIDDPEFREYAEQDVVILRDLAKHLVDIPTNWDYAWREQINAAIDAQNTRNGWTIDVEVAQARVDELKARRDVILAELEEKYGLPTEGKSPWATKEGKAAILAALADYGITPENTPDWPTTKTGNISLGGQELISVTAGTEAEELGQALAELKGQRSLAQLALDSTHSDGKVHPSITTFQRSGRKSVTKPGLTVWSARGAKAVEKSYFIADPGTKLVELDYSQADARIVAAYSGDKAFKERFAPGVDAHELTGRLVFGDEYDENPYDYRQIAKALGHAYAYRAGPKTLAATSGQPLEIAERFVEAMNSAYPDVIKWQEKVTAEGESGWVTNDWGRRMMIDVTYENGRRRTRAWTQAPAMYGQSGTRELMVDSLIRMARKDIRLIQMLKAQVHDALVFQIPEKELEKTIETLRECMEVTFKPRHGGQEVEFPVSAGKPADNWWAASHD